jgi:CRP-like cAMP-binding protein
MLKELFDRELQEEMTDFFLNNLSKKGTIKSFKKGNIIEPSEENICIVVEGMVTQELFSEDGHQITLFMLAPGTIFGEMDYFDGYKTCAVSTVISHDAKISILNPQSIDSEIVKNPKIYNYFMHSIIRKYRILMLKLADDNFNDFKGKLASTLLRFSIVEEGDIFNGARIKNIQSLTMLSKYLFCSRSTLSVAMSDFKSQGIIEMEKSDIIIKDKDRLMEHINFIW